MKKAQVEIGSVYIAKVSGRLSRVKILRDSIYGGWVGLNLDTNCEVRIKTAGRLQRRWDVR